jgi:hypothetical protein
MTTVTTGTRTASRGATAADLLKHREARQEPPMFFPSAAAAVDYAITQIQPLGRLAHTQEDRLAVDMALSILREVSRMHAQLTPETLLAQTELNQNRNNR